MTQGADSDYWMDDTPMVLIVNQQSHRFSDRYRNLDIEFSAPSFLCAKMIQFLIDNYVSGVYVNNVLLPQV